MALRTKLKTKRASLSCRKASEYSIPPMEMKVLISGSSFFTCRGDRRRGPGLLECRLPCLQWIVSRESRDRLRVRNENRLESVSPRRWKIEHHGPLLAELICMGVPGRMHNEHSASALESAIDTHFVVAAVQYQRRIR